MDKKNGFTLIELLAIIVILAIIAVVTVPIILSVIENSRIGAVSNSAYGFKDAIEKYYISTLYDNDQVSNFKFDGEYSVADGKLSGDDMDNVVIPADGKIPTSGFLIYDNNILIEGCVTFDDFMVYFDSGRVSSVSKGTCSSSMSVDLTSIPGVLKDDGYFYIDNNYIINNPVYYNPVTGRKCTDYVSTNSNSGVVSGCLKWYAYSYKDDVVNLLLDHNTSETGVPFLSLEDFNNSDLPSELDATYVGSFSYGSNGIPNMGPLTVLKNLKNETLNWKTKVFGEYSFFEYESSYYNGIHTTIDYSNYKARLISPEELGFTNIVSGRYGAWLEDNIDQVTSYGYWSSVYQKKIFIGRDENGYFSRSTYGVRPVINVRPSVAFSD